MLYLKDFIGEDWNFNCWNGENFPPEIKKNKQTLTWNDAVNADIVSYARSHEWPGSGLNGVKMYCRPNNGTSSNVALL